MDGGHRVSTASPARPACSPRRQRLELRTRMLRFLFGFLTVFAAIYAWSRLEPLATWWGPAGTQDAVLLAAELLAIPMVCAWVVLEAFARLSPRRVFDVRVKRGWWLVVLGVSAGMLAGAG